MITIPSSVNRCSWVFLVPLVEGLPIALQPHPPHSLPVSYASFKPNLESWTKRTQIFLCEYPVLESPKKLRPEERKGHGDFKALSPLVPC